MAREMTRGEEATGRKPTLVGVVRHQAEAAVEVQVGDAVAARREEALQVGALSAEAVLDARPVAVPLAAVPHLPPAHARPAGEAGQRVPRVDEAEAAAAERGEDARLQRGRSVEW